MNSPEANPDHLRLANEVVDSLDVHGLLQHLNLSVSVLAEQVKKQLLETYENDEEAFNVDWEEYIG